jgi:hypothetical protein
MITNADFQAIEQRVAALPAPHFPMQKELDALYAKLKKTTDRHERTALKASILTFSFQRGVP